MESNYLSLLTWPDLVVFLGMFALTFAAVIFGQKKVPTNTENNWLELLLMGRKLTLPLFVTTLVATWYSGIFGVTTLAFEAGVYNFITQGVFWYVTYLIFAFYIVKKIRTFKVLSLPEMVGEKFGPHSRKLVSWLNYVSLLPIAAVLSLGLFIQTLTGFELYLSCVIGLVITLSYTLTGGLRAIVYSDFIQCITMVSTVLMVLVAAWLTFGSPFSMIEKLPPSHLAWHGGYSLNELFLWGFIALSTLIDPNFYQRTLAAASEKVARRGVLISTCIWFCFDICTTLGAFYARAYRPELPSGQSYMIFSMEILPSGLRGFFLAGMLACVLSSLDSSLFTAGGILSYDLFKQNSKARMKLKINMILTGIIALLTVPIFSGSVVKVWKVMGGFSAACLLGPWLLSFLIKKKVKDVEFISSLIGGMIAMVIWSFTAKWHNASLEEFYIGWMSSSFIYLFYAMKRKVPS
jgi:solute:Na+ symporter, SSS family